MRHLIFSIGLVLALIACVFLQGCAATKHRMPVLIPCRTPAVAEPAFPADHIESPDIWDQVKALLADRQVRKGYEVQLKAAVEVCQ